MKTILEKAPGQWTVMCTGLAWAFVYLLTRRLLDNGSLSEGWRIVVALAPLIPFAFFLVFTLAGLRSLDELHRRVQLEALAIAFPLAILLFMLLGLLELAIPLSREDWSYRHTWTYLPLFYFIGLAVAWRRYR
ncbi:MAG TPA: hypothetical protein VK897_24345 [Anaerolineales bacterium]|nr:hypothetical protein [Anaerolineales bacterium]